MGYASEWAKKTEKWFDKFEPESGILHEIAEIFSDDYRKHLFNTTVSGGNPLYGYITDYYQAENEGDSGWQRTGQNLGRSAAILAAIFGLAGAGGAAGGEGGSAAGGAASGEAAGGSTPAWQNMVKNIRPGGGNSGASAPTDDFTPQWQNADGNETLKALQEQEKVLKKDDREQGQAGPRTYAREIASMVDEQMRQQEEEQARQRIRQQAIQQGIAEDTGRRWGTNRSGPGTWTTIRSYIA